MDLADLQRERYQVFPYRRDDGESFGRHVLEVIEQPHGHETEPAI